MESVWNDFEDRHAHTKINFWMSKLVLCGAKRYAILIYCMYEFKKGNLPSFWELYSHCLQFVAYLRCGIVGMEGSTFSRQGKLEEIGNFVKYFLIPNIKGFSIIVCITSPIRQLWLALLCAASEPIDILWIFILKWSCS